MISKRALQEFRLDAKHLQPLFDQMGRKDFKVHEKVEALMKRWRARAQQGRDENLHHYKVFAALDHCWESGFRQTTQTMMGMLRDLTEASGKDVDAVTVAENWGMTHLIQEVKDPKTDKLTRQLDFPVMQEVILGLPRAFTMMRVARIMTERLQVPLMKYEPAWTTKINQFRCEVGTQRVEQGNREFGYSATYCEATQAAARYGQQLMFVQEEWYTENDYVAMEDRNSGKLVIQGGVGKEGLRHVLPHPSRSCIDNDYPAYQINNDIGPRWANYWRTTKIGSAKKAGYWNADKISRSDRFGEPKWTAYFQVHGSCRMTTTFDNYRFSQNDRERTIDRGTTYYSASEDDQPVWETNHFEKFNPHEELEGAVLDDDGKPIALPDCDVWFRIVMSSDDTPIYVTALPYVPVVLWPWEPVGANNLQSSILLELMPYGDHGSNIMTQGLISLEQNNANINFYNKDVGLDAGMIETEVKNSRKQKFRKLLFFGYSGRSMLAMKTDIGSVFQSYRFPQLDVQYHLTMLAQLIQIMKQVAGMSDQETGGSASHEQSAEEIRTIHTATGHRAEYVAAWLDFAFEAWKRQLWTYYSTYGTLPAFASLGPEFAELVAKLEAEGHIKIVSSADEKGRTIVSCEFSTMRVEQFVAQRDGPNRIPWVTIGGQMLNFLQMFIASPFSQSIPAPKVIELVNGALEALQFPRSFRIEMDPHEASGGVSPSTQQFVVEALGKLAEQIKPYVDQKVAEGVKVAVEEAVKESAAQMPPAPQNATVMHNPTFVGNP